MNCHETEGYRSRLIPCTRTFLVRFLTDLQEQSSVSTQNLVPSHTHDASHRLQFSDGNRRTLKDRSGLVGVSCASMLPYGSFLFSLQHETDPQTKLVPFLFWMFLPVSVIEEHGSMGKGKQMVIIESKFLLHRSRLGSISKRRVFGRSCSSATGSHVLTLRSRHHRLFTGWTPVRERNDAIRKS